MDTTNIDLLSKALRTMVFTLAVRKAGYYYRDLTLLIVFQSTG